MLNEEQEVAAELILSGQNCFLTGGGGGGKSYVIKHVAHQLQAMSKSYQICAPTGIAALNVSGSTLHSFFRISPYAKKLSDYLPTRRSKSPLRTLSVLIIDEISMVEAFFLDLLDAICRFERHQPLKPFGGLQVIFVGDFAQLGPVAKNTVSPFYAFESKVWKEMVMATVQLTISERHPDPEFAQFMRTLRLGQIDNKAITCLQQLSLPLHDRETDCYVNDKAVVLESLNVAKDLRNARKHQENPKSAVLYTAIYFGDRKKLKSCLAPDELSLKVGSPVLHLANNSLTGLCNGSSGVVEDFSDDGKPIVRFYDTMAKSYASFTISPHKWCIEERDAYTGQMKTVASKTQYPLVLAYSVSIHKSQGTTLDPVIVNLTDIFAKSQAYVALSRARTKAGLSIIGLDSFETEYIRDLFTPDERVIAFYNEIGTVKKQKRIKFNFREV